MNKRNLKLEKYGISGKRYKELCGFCEQYPEWKREIVEQNFLSPITLSDMPRNPNVGVSNPTESLAIRMEYILHNCDMIETVAKEADPEFWELLIKSICYEVPLSYLKAYDNMPMEKTAFYERRRYFFYLLDKKKRW